MLHSKLIEIQRHDLLEVTYRALFLSQSCIDHALKNVFLQCHGIMCINKTTVYEPLIVHIMTTIINQSQIQRYFKQEDGGEEVAMEDKTFVV